MAAELQPEWISALPSSWSYGVTRDGRVFFLNEEAKSTTWLHPESGEAVVTGHRKTPDLPTGWEEGFTFEGARCFINHNERKVTCKHPVSGLPSQDNCIFVINEQHSKWSFNYDYAVCWCGVAPVCDVSFSTSVVKLVCSLVHLQDSTGMKLWKKRWFVLSDLCLFYYRDEKEEGILGSILLPSFHISKCAEDDHINRKYAFKVSVCFFFLLLKVGQCGPQETHHVANHKPPLTQPEIQNNQRNKESACEQERKQRDAERYGFQKDGSQRERPLTKISSIKLQPVQAETVKSNVTSPQPLTEVDRPYQAPQVNGSEELRPPEGTGFPQQQSSTGEPVRSLSRTNSMQQLEQWVRTQRGRNQDEDTRRLVLPLFLKSDIEHAGGGGAALSEKKRLVVFPHLLGTYLWHNSRRYFDFYPTLDNRKTSTRWNFSGRSVLQCLLNLHLRPLGSSLLTSLQTEHSFSASPEELTLLLIKLRRQQAELNSIREHTVAQLMQLNMDGDNPKNDILSHHLQRNLMYLDNQIKENDPLIVMTHSLIENSAPRPQLYQQVRPLSPEDYREQGYTCVPEEVDTDTKLSRLCEQDKVVRAQEDKLQQLYREKHTLETALLSASQEIELGPENPATLQSVIQQRDLLQSGLLSTCRELTRVTSEVERSWREYDKLEADVILAKNNLLEQLEALGSPQTEPPSQEHVRIQKDLWRIQDVMDVLNKHKEQRNAFEEMGFGGPKANFSKHKNEAEDLVPPRPPLPQSYEPNSPIAPPLPSHAGVRPSSLHRPEDRKANQRNGTHSGPDYRLYKSEPELTTVTEVDENKDEDRSESTDREHAAGKGMSYPVGIVPPRTRSPVPESSSIASYVTLRKSKKPDPRTERPHSAMEQQLGAVEGNRPRMSVEEQLERIRRHQQGTLREKKRGARIRSSSQDNTPSRSHSFAGLLQHLIKCCVFPPSMQNVLPSLALSPEEDHEEEVTILEKEKMINISYELAAEASKRSKLVAGTSLERQQGDIAALDQGNACANTKNC
uniref:Pleckstrin homology domain containing A5 n=1 Tax=Oryzias sinensis TaxID=183150 RepID=A0A8C7XS48_9TELE